MKNAISLFCSSGIGDLGLQANGVRTIIANELLPERARLFQANYPDCKMFSGDIWELKEDAKGCLQTEWGKCLMTTEKDCDLNLMREIV